MHLLTPRKWLKPSLEGGRTQKNFFPAGVTISSGGDQGDAFNCGYRLSEWLQSDVGVKLVDFQSNKTTPDLVDCKSECIEMIIGDVTIR
jgi:hypothetical protein